MKRSLRLAVLAAAVLAAVAFWATPGYVELSIPVAKHRGGGVFWWESHHSKLAYADSAGSTYLHRQVGTAYPDTHGWKTTDEVFAFLDHKLRERGWTWTGPVSADPALPESRLLSPANMKTYRRTDRTQPEPRVLVAVWPIGGAVEGFHVVVTTANPSLWKLLSSGLD